MTKKIDLNATRNKDGVFDIDAYHAMQERDEQLIEDVIVHGSTTEEFVYSFPMQGKTVAGVSVVGARELAYQYGGIKHRIIATLQKNGALMTARSFEPLAVNVMHVHDLADEDDFYEVIIEVTDVKKGNSLQVRKREAIFGKRKDGSLFAREHYDVIAESKAFRNGVLNILPQSVISAFKTKCLETMANAQNGTVNKQRTIQELRTGATRYAMSKGVPLDRSRVEKLAYTEIEDLSRQLNDLDLFINTAERLGVVARQESATESTAEQSYTLE